MSICGFCIDNHQMENYPWFSKLQAIFKARNEETSQRNHGNQEIQEDFKNNKTLCILIFIPNLGIFKHPSSHGLHQTFKTHGEDILMGICHFNNTLILCILNFLKNALNQILFHQQFPKSNNHILYQMLKILLDQLNH